MMFMRRRFFSLIVFCVAITLFASCKKAIQAAEEQQVVNTLTSGTWYISNFTQNGADSTAAFSGWIFQFFDNSTNTATKGSAIYSGTWSGNSANYTFTAAFNTTPPSPLPKIAGTWTVTKVISDSKSQFARTETGGNAYTMEMTKN
jgi:hypothetical protein